MDGYIKLHKKMVDWQWYADSNTKSLFIDLLFDANFEDRKIGFIDIKRGQCLTSLKRMSMRTGLSFQEIRTSLNKLEKSGEINKQSTNKYSIITINKWDDYQTINKQITNNQQTINNIKEIKEINNIKEKIYKKEKYGQFKNVLLTAEEYEKLKQKYSDYQDKIENLSNYIESKGAKYKSHYATILNWARKDDKDLPKWFNQEIKEKEMTDEERKQLQELIRGN